MRDDLNIDLMFPIRDNVSAGLMCVKAELLYDAGVISTEKLEVVIGRAAAMIDNSGRPSGTTRQLQMLESGEMRTWTS